MRITVLLFAVLREKAGVSRIDLDLPRGVAVHEAVKVVCERHPPVQPLIRNVAYALNREYVHADAVLNDGDELALIPPVSGG